ncbi:MAG TPA: LuxR C-terminal-related transcriptional regulator, partial [Acidimicrobiales bacterium]|nr:LuxR C-terminal-related transcriptional regulator [Acidimicrobiales bacterium]
LPANRRADADNPRSVLSSREREVLDLLSTGCRIDHIAERLSISRHTVRTHVRNVISKLGVRSQVEAVAAARRGGELDARQTQRAPVAASGSGGG